MFELKGVPLLLFHAWELHADNLLREYILATGPGYPYSSDDVTTAKQALDAVTAAVAEAEAAAPEVTSLDVTITPPEGAPRGSFSTLQAVLDHGNQLARSGDFLTMPPLPEIVALRNWICAEVIEQAAGRGPITWFLAAAEGTDMPAATWDGVAQLPVDRAWIVGDDHNRIIAASEPAAQLLGWVPHDLVGQRILAVIPPTLREAHVAGFARATMTGNFTLLGKGLSVSAWTRTGATVPITLTLEKHDARGGRTVFVGWLDPRPA